MVKMKYNTDIKLSNFISKFTNRAKVEFRDYLDL